jgi:hypothetical protein
MDEWIDGWMNVAVSSNERRDSNNNRQPTRNTFCGRSDFEIVIVARRDLRIRRSRISHRIKTPGHILSCPAYVAPLFVHEHTHKERRKVPPKFTTHNPGNTIIEQQTKTGLLYDLSTLLKIKSSCRPTMPVTASASPQQFQTQFPATMVGIQRRGGLAE